MDGMLYFLFHTNRMSGRDDKGNGSKVNFVCMLWQNSYVSRINISSISSIVPVCVALNMTSQQFHAVLLWQPATFNYSGKWSTWYQKGVESSWVELVPCSGKRPIVSTQIWLADMIICVICYSDRVASILDESGFTPMNFVICFGFCELLFQNSLWAREL